MATNLAATGAREVSLKCVKSHVVMDLDSRNRSHRFTLAELKGSGDQLVILHYLSCILLAHVRIN